MLSGWIGRNGLNGYNVCTMNFIPIANFSTGNQQHKPDIPQKKNFTLDDYQNKRNSIINLIVFHLFWNAMLIQKF